MRWAESVAWAREEINKFIDGFGEEI